MTNSPIKVHDFQESQLAARKDAALKEQLIKHLNSDELVPMGSSELVDATCNLVNLALHESRKLYAKDSQRLVCVISASSTSNAYAVWGSTRYDWIVLTKGLLTELLGSADEFGRRFVDQIPEILRSPLGKRIVSVPLLPGGFQTSLGSLLYVAALGFFVGHEAGHHLDGHDGYYANETHAEISGGAEPEVDSDALIRQALEFRADHYGVLISTRALMFFILKLVDIGEFSTKEKRQYNRIIAVLLSAGALMALIRIRPRSIDWASAGKSTHPPATLRAIAISNELTVAFEKHFGCLTEATRKWIFFVTLELAAQSTIKAKSGEEKIFRERLGRNELAALRAVGIGSIQHFLFWK